VLEIGDDGSYRINTQPLERASLGARLTEIYARRADRVLFVKAAPALEFSVVAGAIDIARSASVDRIALMPR
jgi:biopolymer transport protein ExbD